MKSNELKSKRIRLGLGQKEVAQKLVISKSSYSKRENGILYFSIKEIKILKILLKLKDEEIIDIFFNEQVASNATAIWVFYSNFILKEFKKI